MLATARQRAFSRPGWLFELKYDGFRLLATKDGERVTLRYRTGTDATAVFPDIAGAVAGLAPATLVLDGEVTVLDRGGKPDFEALQSLAFRGADRRLPSAHARATAFVFDLLVLDDLDLRPLPLLARKECLRELLPDDGRLRYVGHVESCGETLFDGAKQLGPEGIVAKRAGSPYRPGRSRDWIKIRRCERETSPPSASRSRAAPPST